MNEIVMRLGLEAWKPALGSLLLPPMPALLLVLLGLALWRERLGRALALLGVLTLWLGASDAVAEQAKRWLLAPPPALAAASLKTLRPAQAAIVVLGGGREAWAPEYGGSSLSLHSMERLRYGLWLARASGLGAGFSGGVGHAGATGEPEARIAARIAADEFRQPLRWVEDASRDTRENAARTVALLRPRGIQDIVLVTHDWHMPRAQRAFEQAAAAAGMRVRVIPAPVGLAPRVEQPLLRWLPSSEGFTLLRQVVRERIGLLMGA
ncbi:YdcF family protein [Azohydromonas caseinilytica]|uniref:YdcF family protein n=1 Tax=Azohydromonas caseinilytica TaxID=2728836 RepID=A0A848F2S9_9BURK|nr:YdcF family protein [Azohydromonas caseinilytica]NML14357.1 YdcF family protein [Azohydromonas caseinilytica]